MIDLHTTSRRYLRVDEVQELFDVSKRTVYYWIETKKIKSGIVDDTLRIEVEHLRRVLGALEGYPGIRVISQRNLRAAFKTAHIP